MFWEHFLTPKRGSVVGETEMYGTLFGSRKVADVSKYLSVLFKSLFFNSLSYHYLVFSHGIQANHLSTAETKPNQQTKPFKLQKY